MKPNEYTPNPQAVPAALAAFFAAHPHVALAFSGGVDSAYLLYAAKACGVRLHAYYVNTQFQPQFELNDAKRLADALHADMTILPLDVLADETIAANPKDRCYHCKRVIFGSILQQATTDGFPLLMDGSNASDDASDRPGMRALTELKVLSPLREAGLTKAQVREYSKLAGLFTWNKPAYACLATRVPTGTKITAETLQKVEHAENALAAMGFSDFRVRVLPAAAKLQLPANQFALAAEKHTEILQKLSPHFSDVWLDLKPR